MRRLQQQLIIEKAYARKTISSDATRLVSEYLVVFQGVGKVITQYDAAMDGLQLCLVSIYGPREQRELIRQRKLPDYVSINIKRCFVSSDPAQLHTRNSQPPPEGGVGTLRLVKPTDEAREAPDWI
jgi:hypothetical protein